MIKRGFEAGRLRDRIRLEFRSTPQSDTAAEAWTAVSTSLPAESISRGERFAEFNIRFRDDVYASHPDYRVIWHGRIWTITDVEPSDDMRRTILTLRCDFSAMQEATHLGSDRREYIPGLPDERPRSE